jgi:hypothetical protein
MTQDSPRVKCPKLDSSASKCGQPNFDGRCPIIASDGLMVCPWNIGALDPAGKDGDESD